MWVRPRHLAICVLAGVLCGCGAIRDTVGQRRRSAYSPSVGPDTVMMNQAVTFASDGRYEDAARMLTQRLQRFETAGGDPGGTAEAMFWLAFCREKQGRLPEAAALYDRVATEFPDTRAADNALQRRQRLKLVAASRPAP